MATVLMRTDDCLILKAQKEVVSPHMTIEANEVFGSHVGEATRKGEVPATGAGVVEQSWMRRSPRSGAETGGPPCVGIDISLA